MHVSNQLLNKSTRTSLCKYPRCSINTSILVWNSCFNHSVMFLTNLRVSFKCVTFCLHLSPLRKTCCFKWSLPISVQLYSRVPLNRYKPLYIQWKKDLFSCYSKKNANFDSIRKWKNRSLNTGLSQYYLWMCSMDKTKHSILTISIKLTLVFQFMFNRSTIFTPCGHLAFFLRTSFVTQSARASLV